MAIGCTLNFNLFEYRGESWGRKLTRSYIAGNVVWKDINGFIFDSVLLCR